MTVEEIARKAAQDSASRQVGTVSATDVATDVVAALASNGFIRTNTEAAFFRNTPSWVKRIRIS